MPLPQALSQRIANRLGISVTEAEALSGGDITQAFQVTLENGQRLFAKWHDDPPPGLFEAEAEGLRALAERAAVAVPAVLAADDHCLLLELVETAPLGNDFWPRFGEQLATLHQHTAERFGFRQDNYIGLTPQPNPATDNGFDFFREQRLGHQGRLARDRGLLDSADQKRLDTIAARLEDWIPAQPASLLHGDLWSGNFLSDSAGQPVLIDPAAHFGWAEAELAFTTLFGGFDPAFYRAYETHSNIDSGWRHRADLYNLYHLLNHLNLFGSGYLGAVRRVLERYG